MFTVNLAALLKEKGLSKDKLAEKAGVSKMTVYRLCSGVAKGCEFETLYKLYKALELDSVDKLLVENKDEISSIIPNAQYSVDSHTLENHHFSGNSYDDEEYSNLVLLNGVRWGETFYVRVLHPVAREKFGEFYNFDSEQNRQKAIAAGEAEAATYEDVYDWMLKQQQEN